MHIHICVQKLLSKLVVHSRVGANGRPLSSGMACPPFQTSFHLFFLLPHLIRCMVSAGPKVDTHSDGQMRGKELTIHPLLLGVGLFMGWNINASSREGDMSVVRRRFCMAGKSNEETSVDTQGETEDGKQTVTKLGNQGVNERRGKRL